ncbi:GntR family transcriptional regulator [Streptomyces chumphonensis]|uniref:GntR family transcriptional regulator n=1 Tax=Streptomyces chumphonensis TaxID=1214925 RepID=UPI003D74FA35
MVLGMPQHRRQSRPQGHADEVATEIRTRIATGDLSPGEQLPSTRNLVEQFQVPERAIYAAVALLKASGHVYSRQGKGVFVRDFDPLDWNAGQFERGQRQDDPASGVDDWKAAVRAMGREPSQDTPQVTIEPPPSRIAQILGTDSGEFVVVRRRLRRVDGHPFQTADSYFPEQVARDTPLMEERDVTMPGGIMASIGYAQKRIRDEITPRNPTPEECERLDLSPGTPVCEHVRTGYSADDEAFRVMVTIAPGDRNRIIYEMEV